MTNGKQGEALFAQIMTERGYSVKDVSGCSDYWYKDIDFIITSPTTQQVKSFEVKWDSRIHQTGNLYLELTNIHSAGGRGWFQFCEADFLAYGDACAQVFYIIPLDKLREKVAAKPQRHANCGTDSIGILINLRDITDILYILEKEL